MPLPIRTFEDAHPSTSDVVLCHYCGEALHAPEDDVFWHDNLTHACSGMFTARIEELESERDAMRRERDDMRSLLENAAKNILKSLE